MASSKFVAGPELFVGWQQQILEGSPPKTWLLGPLFEHVVVAPGRIVLLGGPPGAGKTALLLQWVFTALVLNPLLKILVANVEMSPSRLLDRQLSRLSGVPLNAIIRREHKAHHEKLQTGFAMIQGVMDRIAFVQGPFDLEGLAGAADEFQADLLVLDYLQRFELAGRHNGLREKINAMMSSLRQFASAGVGILAAAALTRSRDSAGRSSYDGKHLGMASFRESSELEYGCDDAFLLFPVGNVDPDEHDDDSIQLTMLAHVKSRDGEPKSIPLRFHRRIQRFTSYDAIETTVPSVAASVNQVWKGTPTSEKPGEQQDDGAEQW